MQLINHTPFPSQTFQALNPNRQPSHVVVTRITLDVLPDGSLELSRAQEPLVLTDEFHGEPNKSSVKQESDLVPYKPKCDVIVNATAYAPGGKPSPGFIAGVRIYGPPQKGEETDPLIARKEVTVTGFRCWEKGFIKGWKLNEFATPITSLPIRYEYAFGGECRVNRGDPTAQQVDAGFLLTPEQIKQHPDGPDNAPLAHTVYESNPLGIGFMEPWYLKAKGLKRIALPQITCSQDPVLEAGRAYSPHGFGIIAKSWQPRLRLAGTYDDNWLEQRWPDIPDDFDFAFWNGAHPDMQIPYLRGNETIELVNLIQPGTSLGTLDSYGNSVVRLILPACRPSLHATRANGVIAPIDFNIDTLICDMAAWKVSLVYRAILPQVPEVLILNLTENDIPHN